MMKTGQKKMMKGSGGWKMQRYDGGRRECRDNDNDNKLVKYFVRRTLKGYQ